MYIYYCLLKAAEEVDNMGWRKGNGDEMRSLHPLVRFQVLPKFFYLQFLKLNFIKACMHTALEPFTEQSLKLLIFGFIRKK